jgi:hypothetical protein
MVNATYDQILDLNYVAQDKKVPCVILGMKPNESKHLSVYRQSKGQGGVINYLFHPMIECFCWDQLIH